MTKIAHRDAQLIKRKGKLLPNNADKHISG